MRCVVFALCCTVLVCARPLEWFADESTLETPLDSKITSHMSSAVEKDWQWPTSPAHTHQMTGATSFLQVTTGGHPLECDCERVKCNCVKRCECQLPAAAQNRAAAQFLELASATGKKSAPLFVDTETNECFLETGVKIDSHHMLDCECDKVKCNCVKHCECSLPTTAAAAGPAAANDLLQLDQGTSKTEEPAQVEPAAPAVEAKVSEQTEAAPAEQPKARSRKAAKKAESSQYEYQYSQEQGSYKYSYSAEEYSHSE